MSDKPQLYQQQKKIFLKYYKKQIRPMIKQEFKIHKTTLNSPWFNKGSKCAGCNEKIRINDMVIECPGYTCTKIFHQDTRHNLLCWSHYYTEKNKRCPNPSCNYHFFEDKKVESFLQAENCQCQHPNCQEIATHIIPLSGKEEEEFDLLCEEHRYECLTSYYRQQLLLKLRQVQNQQGIPLLQGKQNLEGQKDKSKIALSYIQCNHCDNNFCYDIQSQNFAINGILCPNCKKPLIEQQQLNECQALSCNLWQHNNEQLALVPYLQEQKIIFVTLCQACQAILNNFDLKTHLREQFQRGFFQGVFYNSMTTGDVKICYYCDIAHLTAHNETCIYCRNKFRSNDRVVMCPECNHLYHEDLSSQLMCWSSNFAKNKIYAKENNRIYCANPHCHYQINFDN